MRPNSKVLRPFQIFLAAVILLALQPAAYCDTREDGDFYTSDLVDTRIVVGPVKDVRSNGPDTISNRLVSLSPETIQKEFAEGLAEIHRGASITRISGKADVHRSLFAAREQGADILVMPRIEKLLIDDMGRNGLEPVAKLVDVVLFPVTLAEAAIYRGERAGLGSHYLPMYDMMVTMKVTMEYYRVSDGRLLVRHKYTRACDTKTNKDNLEGSKYDPTDDWKTVGRDQAKFLIRSFGREVATYEIADLAASHGTG